MWYDDPYEECVDWFWGSLGDDDTLPKEFLEYLQQLVEDIDSGKEKLIPVDESFFDGIEDTLKDWEEDAVKYYEQPKTVEEN